MTDTVDWPVFIQECKAELHQGDLSINSAMLLIGRLEKLEAHITAKDAEIARLNAALDDTLKDRDHYQNTADKLAQAIAEITGYKIGEHSNINCPWTNALEYADGHTSQLAAKDKALEEMREALEFYAEEEEYKGRIEFPTEKMPNGRLKDSYYRDGLVTQDKGKKARQALTTIKEAGKHD